MEQCPGVSPCSVAQANVSTVTNSNACGLSQRDAADAALAKKEEHAFADMPSARDVPQNRAPKDAGRRDFIQENKAQAKLASRRPRSASTRQEFSEPKLQPLSKVMKLVQAGLRRNEASGSRGLDLSNFRMGEESAQFLAGVLREQQLVSLKLTNCALTDSCVQHIRQALIDSTQSQLEELFLGVNRLSAPGVEMLCEWMQHDESLMLLDLQLNTFGDPGCMPLATALGKNRHLQALNLQGNAITAKGVSLLAQALAQNKGSALQQIFLGFNPLGDDGVRHLWELMAGQSCALVHTLCLCKCDVTDIGAKLLLEASSASESPLRRVDLSYNAIGQGVMSQVQKRKLQWVNLASAIDVCGPSLAVQGDAQPGVSDARLFLTEGPLEGKARLEQAQEARRASQSSHAARKHVQTWRNMPAPVPPCKPPPRVASAAPTVTLQGAASLGPLYGGRLGPADVRAEGITHYPRSHLLGPLGAARGNGLDFLKEHQERGTVYGNIMGAEEGLRAVAHAVGGGKGGNKIKGRGLKGAPVNVWLGKGV